MIEHAKADLHAVEVRRGRRRGVVDMAAHRATLDGDWRLVLELLRRGARPEAPQGVLFSPLRRSDVDLARELMRLGAVPDQGGLASMLCDVCSHGTTAAAAFLIDECHLDVNTRNERDGDTCTDRALAWHCWGTAEWLISSKGGRPAKVGASLHHLLDAADSKVARRVLDALRARGIIGSAELLTAAVQRGDVALCSELLSTWPRPDSEDACGPLVQVLGRDPELIRSLGRNWFGSIRFGSGLFRKFLGSVRFGSGNNFSRSARRPSWTSPSATATSTTTTTTATATTTTTTTSPTTTTTTNNNNNSKHDYNNRPPPRGARAAAARGPGPGRLMIIIIIIIVITSISMSISISISSMIVTSVSTILIIIISIITTSISIRSIISIRSTSNYSIYYYYYH